ncbi:MAG: hypothetical protein ACOYOP_07700 [Microthrixaceae bacterium]
MTTRSTHSTSTTHPTRSIHSHHGPDPVPDLVDLSHRRTHSPARTATGSRAAMAALVASLLLATAVAAVAGATPASARIPIPPTPTIPGPSEWVIDPTTPTLPPRIVVPDWSDVTIPEIPPVVGDDTPADGAGYDDGEGDSGEVPLAPGVDPTPLGDRPLANDVPEDQPGDVPVTTSTSTTTTVAPADTPVSTTTAPVTAPTTTVVAEVASARTDRPATAPGRTGVLAFTGGNAWLLALGAAALLAGGGLLLVTTLRRRNPSGPATEAPNA